jgi:hypothetical protein
MKKLSKAQEYAVLYLLAQNKTNADIIAELKISEDMLTKFIEKNTKTSPSKDLKVKSSRVKSKDLMINTTSVKGNKSVSIMTKEASQVNDDFKKQLGPTQSRITKNAIYRPNG